MKEVGAVGTGDEVFDFLRYGTNIGVDSPCSQEASRSGNRRGAEDLGTRPAVISLGPGDKLHAKWYAAWIRGFCACHLDAVNDAVTKIVRQYAFEPDSESFRCRGKAKEYARLWKKATEILEELSRVRLPDHRTRWLFITAASFILDIFGCEIVFRDPLELQRCYKNLAQLSWHADGVQVLRTESTFAQAAKPSGGYRDVKLILAVSVPSTLPGSSSTSGTDKFLLPLEMQLHVRSFYQQKEKMHLPYEYTLSSKKTGSVCAWTSL